jgi:hypothetical protein
MNNINNIKGKELEEAVESIEKLILKESFDKTPHAFTIEKNKLIIQDGVRYEIDVYVTIDFGNGYKSVYIFECKNWKTSKVSKNDIIIFNDKIEISNAQKGYFIATNFSSDAASKAKQFTRIELLNASSNVYNFTMQIEDTAYRNIKYTFLEYDQKLWHKSETILPKPSIKFRGKAIDHEIFLEEQFQFIAARVRERSGKLALGCHTYKVEESYLDFFPGELYVEDISMCRLVIKGDFVIYVCEPEIEVSYDISSRGRVVIMNATLPSDTKIKVKLTSYLSAQKN